MWHILKGEIGYYKAEVGVVFGICLLFFAGELQWGLAREFQFEGISVHFSLASILKDLDKLYGFIINTTIAYFIAMATAGMHENAQKIERCNALLPLSMREYGIARLLFVNVCQLALFLLWTCLWLFQSGATTSTTLWGMISANGIILGAITFFTLHHDLGFFDTPRYRRISFVVLFIPIILINGLSLLGYFGIMIKHFLTLFESVWGAAFFTLVWLGMSYLSVVIFVRRKSYWA